MIATVSYSLPPPMSNKMTSYGSGLAGSQSNLALANIDNESQANLPLNQDVGARDYVEFIRD
jgi:hypothetical protein